MRALVKLVAYMLPMIVVMTAVLLVAWQISLGITGGPQFVDNARLESAGMGILFVGGVVSMFIWIFQEALDTPPRDERD